MYYNWWLLDVGKDHESVATDRDDQQDEEDKGDDGADEPEGHINMKKINNNSEKNNIQSNTNNTNSQQH